MVASTKTGVVLEQLPPPTKKLDVAVYNFPDLTGQNKSNDNFAEFSRAVTQGGSSILTDVLLTAGGGQWFDVAERADLQPLLQERQIIQNTRSALQGDKAQSLPPLRFAGVLLEGGIVGYDTNETTGGIGANYLGLGGNMQGHASASIGTIGLVTPTRSVYGSLTTPDPIALHRSLDEIAREGITHLALEASSHGLDQFRLDGVRVAAGGFTNLSRDHMDYHPTVAHYLNAKLRLFRNLVQDGGAAVISADHDCSAEVIEAARTRGLRLITIGRNGDPGPGIKLIDAAVEGFAQTLSVEHEGRRYSIKLPLVGEFQIENALVAAGLVIGTGGDAAASFAALEHLEGAPGRLDLVGARNGAPVFVDYAHKPDALAKTLQALRPYANRKLVVVFGAGGDRDSGKRPLMGAIAAENADVVIITDDNPRSEDPATIRAAILAAAPGAREIGDRAEAIRVAISELQPGDALLIAGKGHETGQIVGDRVLHFSDHDAAKAALSASAA
jgi:UDP-N-acetylmuramoyl-L-alanyl-D-glutamate--2,6-diaminopimelate ligase